MKKFDKFPWFAIGMMGIFLISLGLRFWHLGQFNELVFDEFYYAKFANYYLIGKQFFNSHPPLGQYLIALGIWLGSKLPATPETMNDLTGSLRSTFSYRWLNAFTGAFIPLTVGAIAYHLTNRRSYALIVAFLAASEGLFLVESRYALNNIYLVIFGLLGELFFILALKSNNFTSNITISGMFFGASASVKWNGLGFLLGIYLLLFINWLIKKISDNNDYTQTHYLTSNNLSKINFIHLITYLGLLPLAVYCLLWIPHLLMNPDFGGFWEIQQKILSFHESIGNGEKVHPYCSSWYSWLVLWRSIGYFYEKTTAANGNTVIYDVHALGNPILWWLSTVSIGLFFWLIGNQLISLKIFKNNLSLQTNLGLFILCNYVANLLPWLKISRCTFLYHYMSSYVFAWLALAWILDRCMIEGSKTEKNTAIIILIMIAIAFIFWLPIYLGLPLSPAGFRMRMLFPSWI
jgi:dolichyl-phosphate-mannose--protein O-mannosyl transferase